jgi:hypothetical protein
MTVVVENCGIGTAEIIGIGEVFELGMPTLTDVLGDRSLSSVLVSVGGAVVPADFVICADPFGALCIGVAVRWLYLNYFQLQPHDPANTSICEDGQNQCEFKVVTVSDRTARRLSPYIALLAAQTPLHVPPCCICSVPPSIARLCRAELRQGVPRWCMRILEALAKALEVRCAGRRCHK